MEEEDLRSSLPEVLHAPCQEPRTSTGRQYLNGQQGAAEKAHAGLFITQEEEEETQGSFFNDKSAEAETWEQIIWPVCDEAQMSLDAAVDWDMPRPSSETPPRVVMGRGKEATVANQQEQQDSDGLTLDASFSVHSESVNSDLSKEAEEEQDEFDSWLLLCSEAEWMGPSLKPCDTESTQEEEHSTRELLDHNFGLQGEKQHRDSNNEADFIHSCVEIQFAGFIEDDIEHLRLVESPDQTDILLTGRTDFGEEPGLVNGDEIQQVVTNEEATAAERLSAGEVTAEGFTINPDKLIDWSSFWRT
ncbi:hypothetical protein WMY93_020698 [Mugilogobius chulae]|uniref:Uncharacterized protein n=1 Tax=Mugilogobius chulae TaxID=88201 RepID=A0AAW0N8K8_9GOBI